MQIRTATKKKVTAEKASVYIPKWPAGEEVMQRRPLLTDQNDHQEVIAEKASVYRPE